MLNHWRFVLTCFSGVGSGLMAGLLFAFSAFIMKALARLPPPQGIAAMQSINVAILNPIFFVVFLGTTASCVVLLISSLSRWREGAALAALVGSVLYLGGVILVTAVANVPKNDALAALDPNTAEAANAWAQYVSGWTAWNHVRTTSALAAAVSFVIALLRAA